MNIDIDILEKIMFSIVFFLYGIVIGSFLNVLILRTPLKESITFKRSHCMSCGHTLAWYDLFPLFSYLFLGGKCRYCKAHISWQYPLVEGLNGILYIILFLVHGISIETFLYCLCTSALISLSVIDWRTQEIPVGFNIFILILGLIRLLTDLSNWSQYVIGLFAVSGFLLLIILLTKGRGMGGGDMKLMATTGLLLGWKLNIIAFLIGCILASVIHLTIMAIKKADHVLAFGPYLSAGIYIAMIWGEQLVSWYLSMWAFESLH
ncbi:MAG: prepilin peptidase [Lachnospiraceae bacterium]|nr:prepilin peptidase [Lachnospiraceae bacterium]